jgi:hypothetical protein
VRIFVSAAKLFAQKRPADAIMFWHPSCSLPSRRISFSLPCAGTWHEEARLKMSRLIRELLAAVMITALVSTGAFAQGRGQDKRPDKKPVKDIDGKGGGGGRPSNPPQKPPKEDRGGKKKP